MKKVPLLFVYLVVYLFVCFFSDVNWKMIVLDRKSSLRFSFVFVCFLVGCLTSQLQASVSQGRICTDNFTCCHTEIEVADQTFCLTQYPVTVY